MMILLLKFLEKNIINYLGTFRTESGYNYTSTVVDIRSPLEEQLEP
jgi:hypothetical protein